MSLRSGEKLGSFEILAVLGAGGFGEVYRAKDLKLGREVALKVLRGELSRDPERLRRFEREARAASALNHPNIVTVHDVGTCDSTPFMVMELVEGETLVRSCPAGPSLRRSFFALPVRWPTGWRRRTAPASSTGI